MGNIVGQDGVAAWNLDFVGSQTTPGSVYDGNL